MMYVPLTITFRDVPKTPALEELILRKAAKLEQVCDHLSSCRVTIEQPQTHQRAGNPYRVRLAITVPPGHDVIVSREPTEGSMHTDLAAVVREAFDAAWRQLRELTAKQRGDVKSHTPQDVIPFEKKLPAEAEEEAEKPTGSPAR